MQTAFRFRCYPTAAQEQTLLRWIGCQRFIYNAKVGEDRYFPAFARKSLQHAGAFAPVDQQYSHFITESTPWLRDVPSVLLRNGAVRWKQAYARFFKGLSGRPAPHRRAGAQAVWITSELFRFVPQTDTATGEITHRLFVGTSKFPVGEIAFTAHRDYRVPASITLSVVAGRWFVSGSYDDGAVLPTFAETAAHLATLSQDELLARTVGIDRGVVIPVMASCGTAFDFSAVQKSRMEKKAAAIRRWQRKLSRRTKGGSNRRKAARRIEALHQYARRVREDFAHQTSHAIVCDARTDLIVFEDLGVQRMTRRAKPKQDAHGRFLRNGAAAKSGLNAAILRSAWGRVKTLSTYKALRAGKLCLSVPAPYTSQECVQCGHVHPDNRPTQALFLCQRCGHQDHADANASKVIARRGVDLVRSGQYQDKERKRVMRLRSKRSTVGEDFSERDPATGRKPAETSVRRQGRQATAHRSVTQETPATTPPGV